MSAAPYLPPAAAGSSVIKQVPPSTGSSTIFHLIGIAEAKRGPFQYVHFSLSVSRVPSMITSAPGIGFAPTPMFLPDCREGEAQPVKITATARRADVIGFIMRNVMHTKGGAVNELLKTTRRKVTRRPL